MSFLLVEISFVWAMLCFGVGAAISYFPELVEEILLRYFIHRFCFLHMNFGPKTKLFTSHEKRPIANFPQNASEQGKTPSNPYPEKKQRLHGL